MSHDLLRGHGATPAEVAARFANAALSFDAALARTLDRWNVPVKEVATSPDFSLAWSPAQQAEHVLRATAGFSKMVYLLNRGRSLPAGPRERGLLSSQGRRVSPEDLLPTGGLTWQDWSAGWPELNGRFASEIGRIDPTSTQVFWHLFLGDLGALDWARVAVLHTEGHRRQLGVD